MKWCKSQKKNLLDVTVLEIAHYAQAIVVAMNDKHNLHLELVHKVEKVLHSSILYRNFVASILSLSTPF